MYLEYDLFGLETSYYTYNPAFDMPNDGERMRQILDHPDAAGGQSPAGLRVRVIERASDRELEF